MDGSEDRPASPPLPKGSYNINFDEFDDSIDPFKPRGGLSNSPDKVMSNPFQTRNKMASTPTEETSNPFQTKSKIASSPPKETLSEQPVENHDTGLEESAKDKETDGAGEHISEITSSKAKSPAINIKKPVKGKKKVKKKEVKAEVPEGDDIDLNVENPFATKVKLGQSPPLDVDPFATKVKLGQSPPLDVDPFATKTKLGQSPPLHVDEDPFKTKTELGTSPQNDSNIAMDENPFEIKTELGASPPAGNNNDNVASLESESKTVEEDVQNESADSFKTAEESPEKVNKGLKTRAKSQTPPVTNSVVDTENVQEDVDQDGGSEPSKPKPEKKIPSPKKSGIKKPKARSKFKPPPNFGVQDSEDVVIYAPPPSQSANNNTASDHEAPGNLEDTGDKQLDDEINNSVTNQMTASEVLGGVSDMIDSVHDFGACEMPMESNEDFVPASEAFDDEEAWEMMERMKHENGAPPRDSLNAFDPLAEQPVPDKAVNRRVSDSGINENSNSDDEDLLLMNTPPPQKQQSGPSRGVSRHPAARALQEHVDGDGAPREAQIVDKMLFSPGRGEEGRPRGEGGERYFDAPEYPLGSHKAQHKKKSRSELEVERMNAANKKHVPAADSNKDNIVQLVQVLKYSQSDWNKMKQELELDFNARILNKEREWSKKLADREKKISYLTEQQLLLRSSNEDMKLVVTEFEKTIAQLQAEKEKSTTESQQGFEDVIKERDQALEDLQSVETAFSDLHQRYERAKGVVEGFKKNEDVLKKCVSDYQNKLKSAEEKTISVRQQAEEKLALASDEMEKLRRSTTAELARLEAALKKAELKTQGLERSLEQKVQENNELTAICDELIAKVSTE
ncbi:transforming acidic coiled-coil-containing protein 2-like isoform X3 [Ruditapes philippinarum]|uniref:transforming acidic coiled-coil-containing protein 2-like isoform X3 n=1 Tax=Ruditapes philippinarum TaxID=129788 RepID=UPI00295C3557|nr:transforming acidic coiled-coil-containing protein 2-like isoform X3 [Ruditapes philippinarum]